MKNLREALSDYLSLRRGLGFSLNSDGRSLSAFVSFLEQHGVDYISSRLAAEWCLHGSAQPITKVRRLCYVRGFAKYLTTTDPRNEVPSQDLITAKSRRKRPYLYTDDEVQRLMAAALNLDPVNGLRHLTYHYLLGLLAVTGMRISEAINLKVDDVDLDGGMLTVRGTKFGKSRLVPLHATTRDALRTYKAARDRTAVDGLKGTTLFISSRCKPLNYRVVLKTFDAMCRQIGIRGQKQDRAPRIHDLRHRMAVKTLLCWYRKGDNPERRLPALATYLGHVHVADTYWYLTACPELMEEAVKRLEQRGR